MENCFNFNLIKTTSTNERASTIKENTSRLSVSRRIKSHYTSLTNSNKYIESEFIITVAENFAREVSS